MNLTTTYMGLELKNPLVASASPLSQDIVSIKRLEEAGLSAIVFYSLFEEQISREIYELNDHLTRGTESYPESLSYFPEPNDFVLGPEEYLAHISKAKQSVKIPIIASLNGHSMGGWTKYAKKMEDAGADGIELNIYFIPTQFEVTAQEVEQKYIEIVESVKSQVKIPVAVKLNPYFSAMANMASKLDAAGADALVLFNRFYQPDIDLEHLEVFPNLLLSTPQAMRLPLRWTAILYGNIKASLGTTSGIHTSQDVIKMIMVGADVTMLCAALLKNGINYAEKILREVREWMKENEYNSIEQMKGSMSQQSCENPEAFERANYMKMLRSFHFSVD